MSYLVTRINASTGRTEYLQPEGSERAFKRAITTARRFTTYREAVDAACDNEGIEQI